MKIDIRVENGRGTLIAVERWRGQMVVLRMIVRRFFSALLVRRTVRVARFVRFARRMIDRNRQIGVIDRFLLAVRRREIASDQRRRRNGQRIGKRFDECVRIVVRRFFFVDVRKLRARHRRGEVERGETRQRRRRRGRAHARRNGRRRFVGHRRDGRTEKVRRRLFVQVIVDENDASVRRSHRCRMVVADVRRRNGKRSKDMCTRRTENAVERINIRDRLLMRRALIEGDQTQVGIQTSIDRRAVQRRTGRPFTLFIQCGFIVFKRHDAVRK